MRCNKALWYVKKIQFWLEIVDFWRIKVRSTMEIQGKKTRISYQIFKIYGLQQNSRSWQSNMEAFWY